MTEVGQVTTVLRLRIVSTPECPWQAVLTDHHACELRFDSPLELAQYLAKQVRRSKRTGLK